VSPEVLKVSLSKDQLPNANGRIVVFVGSKMLEAKCRGGYLFIPTTYQVRLLSRPTWESCKSTRFKVCPLNQFQLLPSNGNYSPGVKTGSPHLRLTPRLTHSPRRSAHLSKLKQSLLRLELMQYTVLLYSTSEYQPFSVSYIHVTITLPSLFI
jgi:hypothetical protein